ncbi:condensin-2 complex subunit G2 [Synchiropus splendidus]|uniref:condensin-2 complex subunit G2 n=1 Tax=Synchiropus splendidus TaxID=270530 RepID=UPI00237E0CB8|nr:condensin-2 complex subunit G2 [Synchiropus splendidus]XP_053715887.1 condensin-2 complex subunit G2 [Synchiropus splendidus]
MSKRKAFFDAACKENADDFLHFIRLHKDKTDPFDVEEVVQEMPNDQREGLWKKLAALLQDVLTDSPPEENMQADRREQSMEEETSPPPENIVSVVDGVTIVATVSLNVLQDGDTYNGLLQIANHLHGLLVSQQISDPQMHQHIHTLFEVWWKKDLTDKAKFGRSALFVSLQKCFTLKKSGAEIQRLWNLHSVILTLDYKSEDNRQIVDLLLQCFHSPSFIRNDDGKRFLVFLFSWDITFISAIHGTVKNQLEFFNSTATSSIAEIYFRAWKKASGDFLDKIESSCIQDLMQNCILLHRASPVHSKVRQIISHFHSRKGCTRLDKMLHNLYKPILWKALSAPNFEVRANAALLFTEAFPIHDPSETNEHVDKNIQRQLDAAMNLLDDPHPSVRCNTTLGVCKILAKCWELLSPTIITDFLKKLVMELATDNSSPDVRCSVFKSLSLVLDNALSHPLLEKLLPTLKYSLHDSSEKVRSAFLDMLIKVKAVRAAKFWDVCSMEHLLARLAIDSTSVSKRIVSLLYMSFFPVNESEREWCSRCITLIQMNPMAARKFYQNLYRHTAPTNMIKMMLAIRRLLNSCINADFDRTDLSDPNKENSIQSEHDLMAKDMALVASLLEIIVILWRSVDKALKQNEEAMNYTYSKFGSVVSKYFTVFQSERCTASLIQLASLMPPNSVPTFSCGVLSKLRKMDSSVSVQQYSQLLDCLCAWGQAAVLLELVTDWLTNGLPKNGDTVNVGRKVRIAETDEAKPDLALAYIEYLFSHSSTREKVLALGQSRVKPLYTALGNWKSVLYTHLNSTAELEKTPSVDVALKAFIYHGRLGAHLQHTLSEGRDYLLSLEHVAAWVAERVLPFLTKCSEKSGDLSEQPLAAQIIESFLLVCRDVLLVGLADENFKGGILHLCSLILHSEAGYFCIPGILSVLKEVVDTFEPDKDSPQDDAEDPTIVLLGVVANIFQKIIELLARRLKKEPEDGRQLCQSAVPGLVDFLQVAQMWDRPPLIGVFSTLFAIIIVEKRHSLQKMNHPEEVITPESVEDMPPLSSVLLSVILKSRLMTRTFLSELGSSLEAEAIDSLVELAAVLHVLAVIRHHGQSKAPLKSVAISVQQNLLKHSVSNGDNSDIQRAIYDSSVKTLNEILDS